MSFDHSEGMACMLAWTLAASALGGCGSNFYALSDPPPDGGADAGVETAPADDDGGGETNDVDAGADAPLEATATDGGSDAREDDAAPALCCELALPGDTQTLESCSPSDVFSCDLDDGGQWVGCTTAAMQGTPCRLGMACRNTFEGKVVPCL